MMRYAQTIYKVSVVQGLCKVVFQEFYLTENSYSISKELTARVAQTGQLEFLHKSGIALRPGGTPEISRRWNRRDRDPNPPAPEGRQTEAGLSPLRGSRIYLYSLPVVTLRSTTG